MCLWGHSEKEDGWREWALVNAPNIKRDGVLVATFQAAGILS